MSAEQKVGAFVSEITRGPFRCLNDEQSGGMSGYVVGNSKHGDIYACAVYQAYLDMCRTVSGAGKGKRQKAVAQTLDNLAESLQAYFASKPKTSADAFDGWYSSVASARFYAGLTFGQIQKLLNMAFKYLYCCKDVRETKPDHFACCHMALDGYTLAWYKRECASDYDGEAWSAIDDVRKYYRIQNDIRTKLEGENVLLAEFDIWTDEKARAERSEVRKAALRVAGYEECPTELKTQLEEFASSIRL